MKKVNVEVESEKGYEGLGVLLSLILLFVIMPFLTQFVWNVLVVGLFGVASIGYGGAWALMVIRSFFFKAHKKTEIRTPKEDVANTLKQYGLATMIAIGVIIIGMSNGYM